MSVFPYLAWYSNKHELLSRPYVQMVWRYFEFGFVIGDASVWLDGELAPDCVNIRLLVIHSHVFHQVVANGRVCSISSQHEVELDFNLFRSTRGCVMSTFFKPGLSLPEVCTSELVIKEELNIGHLLEDIQKTLVEIGSINSKDCLWQLAHCGVIGSTLTFIPCRKYHIVVLLRKARRMVACHESFVLPWV